MRDEQQLPPHYDLSRHPFMRRTWGPQAYETESSVSIPPALIIQDSEGTMWTLGFDQGAENFRAGFSRLGEYEYDVVRNGRKTGEYACRIEYKAGRVRIFGSAGWRTWTGRQFV